LKISYRALIYKIHDAGLITRKVVHRNERVVSPSSEPMQNYATD